MRFYCLVIALALLAVFASDSWGQSKQQPSRNETQKAEQSSKTDQRGTPAQPLTINVVPTAEQKTDAEKKDAEAAVKAADDKKLVEYTGYQVLIGVVTFLIFVLQLVAFSLQANYMKRTVVEMRKTTHATIRSTRAAQKAANAAASQAKIAESALLQLERPYIFIFGVCEIKENMESSDYFVEYTVVNYGKMPAIIDGAWIDFVTDNTGQPPIPPLLFDGHSLLSSPILQSGERREKIRGYVPSGMVKGQSAAVIINTRTNERAAAPHFDISDGFDIYFRATIRYHGPASGDHETGALWIYNPGSFEFAQRGGNEYNYIK